MSKYQDGEKISWLSKKMISWTTDLDPLSLSPFEETMVQGMCFLIILNLFMILKQNGRLLWTGRLQSPLATQW